MKRYILSMALGVFAVGAIGTYYASGTEGDAPLYKLVTLEGDVQEAANMQLGGHYIGGVGSKGLELTVAGTKYQLAPSFYEKYLQDNRFLTTQYEDMKALKQEHRNFMRGRSSIDSFYRDSDWVIYADAVLYDPSSEYDWRSELRMDVLEEATGKVAKHRIDLDESNIEWFRVNDVQRIGDEVHILAQVRQRAKLPEGGWKSLSEEFRDYVVDLGSGKLLRRDVLMSEQLKATAGTSGTSEAEPAANVIRSDLSLSIAPIQRTSQPSEYVVLQMSRSSTTGGEGVKEKTTLVRKYAVYSYRTGKLTPLPESSTDISAYSHSQSELNGDILTVMYFDNRSLAISRYNVATETLDPGELTLTAKQAGGQSIKSVTLAQDRVYALLSSEDSSKAGLADSRQITAVVLDAGSGKTLYRGEAAYEGPADKAEEFRKKLWLTNIYANRS